MTPLPEQASSLVSSSPAGPDSSPAATFARERRRRALRRRLLWSLVGVAGLLLAGRALFVARQPPVVEVETLVRQDVERTLAVLARVRPALENDILPLTSGRLVELPLEEGQAFRRGDLLARIEDREAQALLAQAEARVEEQRANLAKFERELRRAENLAQQGLVAPSDLESARSSVGQSRGILEARDQAVAEQRARLDQYRLRAPFDGRVLRRPVDPGQVVSPSTVLYEVASSGAIELEAEVDEQLVRSLAEGLPARVALDPSAPQEVVTATIFAVAAIIDRETGAATVRLRLDEPLSEPLPSGLSVDVNIIVERHLGVVTVPRGAVLGGGANDPRRLLLWRDSAQTLEERPVEVIEWPAPRLVVRGGVVEGDQVVLDPRDAPRGRRVRTIESAASTTLSAPVSRSDRRSGNGNGAAQR